MVTIALILDTETQGVDKTRHVAIEVAAMRFDLVRGIPLSSFSTLLRADSNEAESTNGIPVDALVSAPIREVAWKRLANMAADVDVVVAHNAEFDRAFVPDLGKPWVCSMDDVPWPKRTKPGMSLTALALAHGIGVVSAHRAMTDVDTLARLFSRVVESGADVQAMFASAMRPKVRVVGKQRFDENDVAKANGFRWSGEDRVWWRNMPIEDVAGLPFATSIQGS